MAEPPMTEKSLGVSEMYCAAVVYARDPEGRFDLDYFADKHAPMFANRLGDNCRRYEVHIALETPGAPTPDFVAAAYFWVESAAEFGAALASHGPEIYGDIPNFSDRQPSRSWAEVRVSGPS
jgi:uncharacterized protein (TIGR02118 family)